MIPSVYGSVHCSVYDTIYGTIYGSTCGNIPSDYRNSFRICDEIYVCHYDKTDSGLVRDL